MNRVHTNEVWPVMQHYASGGNVQYKKIVGDTVGWIDCDFPAWNWDKFHYRIKPQPVEVTCYAVISDGTYHLTFRSHYDATQCAASLTKGGSNAFVVVMKGTYTCDT